MNKDTKIFRLLGVVQHYSWGGNSLLPALLTLENQEGKPFAEYWMGAHRTAPSQISDGIATTSLYDAIQDNPEEFLGNQVVAEFGQLPFLFKVLDVNDMLSIQVHPSKAAAQLGFEQENILGIPLNAPERNFKDANHKPELMVALSEFWLLHGFKSPPLMEDLLRKIPEFAELLNEFQKASYRGLYEYIMTLPQEEVNRMLEPLLNRIIPAYQAGQLRKDQEDFWAARAAITFNQPGRIDRGIISVYIFNLVHLREGEGIFQDAGILHAYLEGWNMELMASSDNVLRGGLTTKHVNVAELLKHVRFEPVNPEIISGTVTDGNEKVYYSPAEDFQLSLLQPGEGVPVILHSDSAEILLQYAGEESRLMAGDGFITKLNRGDAVLIKAGTDYRIEASAGTYIYRASLPSKK